MIRIDQLTIDLAGRRVLDGVSLDLPKGQVTVILGPNGAGKSTLLRAMAGLLPPNSGTITLDGAPLAALPLRDRAKRIGYLPQNGAPAWAVTVRDLVALGRLPHRAPWAAASPADAHAVEAALMATDLLALADRTVDSLSGGERARATFARVLAGENDWICADEPLASLDPPHQHDVLRLLRRAADSGKAVVVVLHQLMAAAALADQIILLKQGRVLCAGPKNAMLTAENLSQAFDMPMAVHKIAGQTAILPHAPTLADPKPSA